jgi:predicted ferric reductase
VLISTLPWVEAWFDGIDRAAIWHRRVAMTGIVLLIPHIALAANPHKSSLGPSLAIIGAAGLVILAGWAIVPRWRSLLPAVLHRPVLAIRNAPGIRHLRKVLGGYERWRSFHRLTGLFVAAGLAHGLLDGTPFPHAPLLRWTFMAIGGAGLAFYAYRELLARHLVPLLDYQVSSVQAVGSGIVEIALTPLGRPVAFAPGQFAMLFLEGKDGWHRHPFTIASAPREGALRFAVKALGDDTSQLQDLVRPGMRGDRRPVRPVQPRERHPPADLDRRRHRSHALPQLAAGSRPAPATRTRRLFLHVRQRGPALRAGDKGDRRAQQPGACPLRQQQQRRAPHR